MWIYLVIAWLVICTYGVIRNKWMEVCCDLWIHQLLIDEIKPGPIPDYWPMFLSFWHWDRSLASWR